MELQAISDTEASLPLLRAPVIDWEYQRQFRTQLFQHCKELELPKYLLKTEIKELSLCDSINEHQRMLLLMLFNTGARINELLAVTPNDVFEVNARTLVKLKTLKQQRRNRQGRPTEGSVRVLPLFDKAFASELKRYIVTHCSNKKYPIFASQRDRSKSISDETARNWLLKIEHQYLESGRPPLTIHLSPRVLRHSFAMHLIFHRCHIKRVQALLGHTKQSSTEIYTRMAAFDVGEHIDISFI